MKLAKGFQHSLKGLTDSVARYPLTTAFLLAAAVINAGTIQGSGEQGVTYGILLLTCAAGVFLSTTAQVLHEGFFPAPAKRALLTGIACVLALGYFLIVKDTPAIGTEILVRTAALLSALFMAFIWLPSIKAKISFSEAFMGMFKGLFISLFFSGVIFAGVGIILSAVDLLLFGIDSRSFAHAANIIFVLFAPMYFLSLVPNYSVEDEDKIKSAVNCPKFLEILISNIIIPLTSIFTVILVLYIALNITGSFWADNLIEPMLVAYSIVVIVVYILAGNLENKFAKTFKKVFPKVLIPVVLFQILASVLKIGDVGLTHSRYYAILYGFFAVLAGVVYSFFGPAKRGIVPAAFIILSVFSALPPIDAFTVSKLNQIGTLEKVLVKNGILADDRIVPKENIPDQDKLIIVNTASYISRMGYAGDVPWLADDFNYYSDFERTFGFSAYDTIDWERPQDYHSFMRSQRDVVDVSGYEMMALVYFSSEGGRFESNEMALGTGTYYLSWQPEGQGGSFVLKDESGSETLSLDIQDIIDRFQERPQGKEEISAAEASFTAENDRARMKVVINFMEINQFGGRQNIYGEAYVLVQVKTAR